MCEVEFKDGEMTSALTCDVLLYLYIYTPLGSSVLKGKLFLGLERRCMSSIIIAGAGEKKAKKMLK